MHYIRPTWITHTDDKSRCVTVFSLSVHPDGSRLATGGLDTMVKVWNTKAIRSVEGEGVAEEKGTKLLATLAAHAGVVMCVRWSWSGRYLASGADDNTVMIWSIAAGGGAKVFGSTTENKENWRVHRRLTGHQSDVTDLAWSPSDTHLASVSLDGQVLIWSGHSFDLLRRLKAHDGFIKGVVFDPVGQYLATQADDRSMRIWRTTDWALDTTIGDELFKEAPSTTFTRLSWSPCGNHIVVPNAMNKGVFVAGCVNRPLPGMKDKKWNTDTSLVGHSNFIEITAFNPKVFLRDPKNSATGANLCVVLAVAARNTVSIWNTVMATPIVVVDEVLDRDVLDLSWTSDGLGLYCCSSDGHVALISFTMAELGSFAPESAVIAHHTHFGFKRPAPLQPIRSSGFASSQSTPSKSQSQGGTYAQPNMLISRKGVAMGQMRKEGISVLVPKKKGVLVSQPAGTAHTSVGGSRLNQLRADPFAGGSAASTSGPATNGSAVASTSNSVLFNPPPVNGIAGAHGSMSPLSARLGGLPPEKRPRTLDPEEDEDMYLVDGPSRFQRVSDAPYRGKGRTLGGEQKRVAIPPEEWVVRAPAYVPVGSADLQFRLSNEKSDEDGVLAVPEVVSFGRKPLVDGEGKDEMQWRNFEPDHQRTSEVCVISNDKTIWLDYLPSYIVAGAGSPSFVAVSSADGALNVYTATGRRAMPIMLLDSPASFMTAEKNWLMVVTALGSVSVWDVRKKKALFPPLSVVSLLKSSATSAHPQPTIATCNVLSTGAPLVALTSGVTLAYSADLGAWTPLSSGWWADGSDFWEGRRGRTTSTAGRGAVRTLESAINDIVVDVKAVKDKEKEDVIVIDADTDPESQPSISRAPAGARQSVTGEESDFTSALSLGHLETRMSAAEAVNSPGEWKAALLAYAKKLADEGFRGKGEELAKELLGPVYHNPSRDDAWQPSVLGLQKRDLLRDVLNIFVKSRNLVKLGQDYQDVLKKISGDMI